MKIETLQKIRLGGAMDAWSLTAIGTAVVASSPMFFGNFSPLAMQVMSFMGAAFMAERFAFVITDKALLKTNLEVVSSDPPISEKELPNQKDSLLFGYTTDNGLPVYIPYEDLTRHCLILGSTGMGKTVLGSSLMRQHALNGGGIIFIDGKMNLEDLDSMHRLASECGRAQDLRVINPGNPALSNTYNPILYGDPDEVASRILSLIPDASSSPGADYFRQSALQAVTTLIRGIQCLGKAYHFLDLSILLSNPRAMMTLQRMVLDRAASVAKDDMDTRESIDDILLFLNRFTTKTAKGVSFDVNKMKEQLGGISGRLHSFGTGTFGRMMNHYSPEINLYEDIISNKIIYVMLPTMGKPEAAISFAKMFMGDYRTAVSWIQRLPPNKRPNPPTLVFADEAGSYFNQSFPRLMEQARSARQMIFPAAQIQANFDAISEDMGQMVMGNTYTKVFFRLGTAEASESAAKLIGMRKRALKTVSDSDSESDSVQTLRLSPDAANSFGQGLAIGMREEEVYRVHPDEIAALDKGQCIVVYGDGGKVYDLRVPMFSLHKDLSKAMGVGRINHRMMPKVEGLSFTNKIAEFVEQMTDSDGGDE